MAFTKELINWYEKEFANFQQILFVQNALQGKLSREVYKNFLMDYVAWVQNAARMYSLAAQKISSEYPRVREWFHKAAFKEWDHDQFIIRDLKALGASAEEIKNHRIGPSMDALCSYNLSFPERHHPVGMLGTPFLMGRLSAALSLYAAEKIKTSLGLQDEGASFFFAHGHLDKELPEDVATVIESITDKNVQADIVLNAQAVFMLYQNFFRTLTI